jgi:hypothetical protein
VQQLHAVACAITNATDAVLRMVGCYNLIFRRLLTDADAELWPVVGCLLLAALAANTASSAPAPRPRAGPSGTSTRPATSRRCPSPTC